MQFANIQWKESINCIDTPYSIDFNDIYFSTDDGLQETEYVFIAHNQLKKRFKAVSQNTFCVAETGFGTGLNFLVVASHWLALAPITAKLRFISIEKYPLRLDDLTRALQVWPQFSELAHALIFQYSHLKTGCNDFTFSNNRIELLLHIGDVIDVLPSLQITDETCVNAWLLDGFSPAKNADMWSADVLQHIARISGGGSTFATFTSAGMVRRNLEAIGFYVEKHAGYGKKREMMAGYLVGTNKGQFK